MFWAHKNPIEFTEFIRSLLGEQNFAQLKKLYNLPKQWSLKELKEIYETFNRS